LAAIVYEGMFIPGFQTVLVGITKRCRARFPPMVEKLGGEMLVSRLWEEAAPAPIPLQGQDAKAPTG